MPETPGGPSAQEDFAGSPAIANGVFYIGSWDKQVYAFGLAAATQLDIVTSVAGVRGAARSVAALLGRAQKESGNYPMPDRDHGRAG